MKDVLFIQGGGEGAHAIDQLLAASLQRALGTVYRVHYPKMPDEASPEYTAWKVQIEKELASLDDEIILVGHSLGGALLLKYLSEELVRKKIAGLFLIAVPAWDDQDWAYDDLRLPRDAAARLRSIPRIFLYHSRDDAVVPFAHLALHAARLPQAIIREADGRGHQFGNDLSDIAKDITGD